MLDTPNNLTRNILLGMFAGFVVVGVDIERRATSGVRIAVPVAS